MPDIRGELDRALYALTMEHLAKLAEYIPGPVKKRGSRDRLLAAYQQDPVYSIFGLDSHEYLGATLAGGTVTSIHRKIGDIYEGCIKTIFMHVLKLAPTDVIYSTIIRSGDVEEDRSADVYLQFDRLDAATRKRVSAYCRAELAKLTPNCSVENLPHGASGGRKPPDSSTVLRRFSQSGG